VPRKQPVRFRVPWDFLFVAVPSNAAAQLQRQHAQQADIGRVVNLVWSINSCGLAIDERTISMVLLSQEGREAFVTVTSGQAGPDNN
jgi:hypothetical protein